MIRAALILLASVVLCLNAAPSAGAADEGWVSLFDGKTLQGWKKAEENPDSWRVEDGALVCQGPRCHLFYDGELAPMANFEFKADVKTRPGSNSGIYIHTKYQAKDWPRAGYEVQVNNTHTDPVKTGSLYGTEKILEAPAKDDEWFEMHIVVQGKNIKVAVNGKPLVNYTEPQNKQPDGAFVRILGQGTIALQAHDPNSTVYYKNLLLKKLP